MGNIAKRCSHLLFLCLWSPISCNESADFHGGAPIRSVESADAQVQQSWVQRFPTAESSSSHLAWSADDWQLTQSLTFSLAPATEANITQIERTLVTDTFVQGSSGQSANETFEPTTLGLLDLLIVVDNSNSMTPYQNLLAGRLDPLLSFVTNTDWQIAVVTTDSSCLRGNDPITRSQFDNDQAGTRAQFQSLIQAGSEGGTVERGFLNAVEGFRGTCSDPSDPSRVDRPWRRDGAHTAVLFLTDEENCGSAINEGCDGDPDEKAEYLVANLPEDTSTYGILFDENSPLCPFAGWEPQTEYRRAIDLTGGIWGNICEADYTTVLEEISKDIAKDIRYEFDLAHDPVLDSLTISLDGRTLVADQDYRLEAQTITVLTTIADDAETLEVNYLHDPTPIVDRFTLSQAPDATTLAVIIDEEEQIISYVEETQEVSFAIPPPEEAEVTVQYRVNDPLPSAFTIDRPEGATRIDLKIDGEPISDYAWQQGQLEFATPPEDGATIVLRYQLEEEIQTDYGILTPESGTSFETKVFDAVTGKPIAFSIEEDHLSFDADDVTNERSISVVHTWDALEEPLAVALPETPSDANIETKDLELDAPWPQDCALWIEAQTLRSDCIARDLPSFQWEVPFHTTVFTTFDLSEVIPPDATMSVSIDGVSIEDFALEGRQLIIREEVIAQFAGETLMVRAFAPTSATDAEVP